MNPSLEATSEYIREISGGRIASELALEQIRSVLLRAARESHDMFNAVVRRLKEEQPELANDIDTLAQSADLAASGIEGDDRTLDDDLLDEAQELMSDFRVDEEEISPALLEEELSQRLIELQRLQEQLKESEQQRMRLAADYDNLSKRTAIQLSQMTDFATAKAVDELLAVFDAISKGADAFPDVLRPILQLVKQSLAKLGVTVIDLEEVGKPIDLSIHEVILTTKGDGDEYKVQAIARPGYRLDLADGTHILIRPAQVVAEPALPTTTTEEHEQPSA